LAASSLARKTTEAALDVGIELLRGV